MEIASRHHLRSDAVGELETTLNEQLGVRLDADSYELVELADEEFDVVLVDGDPAVFYVDEAPFLTVTGANLYPPERRTVTVDAGAVQFVSDGADVMRPGIIEADPAIEPNDLVVIAEETHGKILAIGRSRVNGDEMVGEQGKVIDSIHHVGDELFEFDV